jgi:predicted ribosome quality control (RQC) complex YloA/Tae2 family protein
MNPLVLVRVAQALDRSHRGSVLASVRDDGRDRLRLELAGEARTGTIVVSLRPERPWIGTVRAPAERARSPRPFAAACARALEGAVVASIAKDPVDRIVRMSFADGHALAIELATHGANAVLLDREGKVLETARRPGGGRERLAPGAAYAPRGVPERQIAASHADPGSVDGLVAGASDPVDALRRSVFGLGTEGAALVVEESRLTGERPGNVLAARLAALEAGSLDPVIQGPGDPSIAAELPGFDPAAWRLLPWEPLAPGPPLLRGEDAAGTAGLYHAALERAADVAAHLRGLLRILVDEIDRTGDAERKAREDLARHESPERYRIWGEAVLAGLGVARRSGDRILVPDPYDVDGRTIAVEAPASLSLTAAADDLFRRHRRATRGLASAKERASAMADRAARLEDLRSRFATAGGSAACDDLAERMRKNGIPVSLPSGTKSQARRRPGEGAPRVEGVRIVTSSDGLEILVGRTGRDNDRLTFRLAGPEDFWLHAEGVPGAHVVVRNPGRSKTLPERTLREAASLAAWFSDAREQGAVEVRWTRRKNVRRIRGALPGTVQVKRFESVRVRPVSPKDGASGRKDGPTSY